MRDVACYYGCRSAEMCEDGPCQPFGPAAREAVAVRPCIYAHNDVCSCFTAAGERDPSRCPRLHAIGCAACAAGVPLNKYGIHESATEPSSVCTNPESAPLHRRRESVTGALLRQHLSQFPGAGLLIVAGN
jgi:hypothetical protein